MATTKLLFKGEQLHLNRAFQVKKEVFESPYIVNA